NDEATQQVTSKKSFQKATVWTKLAYMVSSPDLFQYETNICSANTPNTTILNARKVCQSLPEKFVCQKFSLISRRNL
ncbi:MAG: hypothetical protein LBE04_00190, partial [Prevotellaceae bacterium]|nr:hypothetical protein [Prevotellaceae bacterium]